MAKFKRTIDDGARKAALRRRAYLAQQLKNKPAVATHHVATGGRSEVRHILANRDNAKRGRVAFKITDDEAKQISASVEGIRRSLLASGSLRNLLETIGEAMISRYRQHISSGSGFAPLTPAYAKRVQGKGRIMHRTGALLDSVRFKVSGV